jgi:hypothetical protein
MFMGLLTVLNNGHVSPHRAELHTVLQDSMKLEHAPTIRAHTTGMPASGTPWLSKLRYSSIAVGPSLHKFHACQIASMRELE